MQFTDADKHVFEFDMQPFGDRYARYTGDVCSKVLEGHHPRGTTLREALRGNLRRGFFKGSAGFCGGLRDFPGVVTLCL